jgi:H/ACA ribonucleoprotein complex subunit 2
MSKDSAEKKVKKDKKEKKEKRADTEGVTKPKKDKKEKKVKADAEMVDALDAELEKAPEVSLVNVVQGDEPRGALVPFAFPLSEDAKEVKKILKTVKKCTSSSQLPALHYIPYAKRTFLLTPPPPSR